MKIPKQKITLNEVYEMFKESLESGLLKKSMMVLLKSKFFIE